MNYNKLSAAVMLRTILPEKTKQNSQGKSELYIDLFVDDKLLVDNKEYKIYPRSLRWSLEKENEYYIICCGCSYAFCGAGHFHLPITVKHRGNAIIWSAKKELSIPTYRFKRRQYEEVVNKIEADLDLFFRKNIKKIAAEKISIMPMDILDDWRNK